VHNVSFTISLGCVEVQNNRHIVRDEECQTKIIFVDGLVHQLCPPVGCGMRIFGPSNSLEGSQAQDKTRMTRDSPFTVQ
jgi:hypothetical protein